MNWETILLAVITSTPPTLVALAAYRQASKTHEAVNSRMTELLAISKKAAADEATLTEKRAENTRKGEAAAIAVNLSKESKP